MRALLAVSLYLCLGSRAAPVALLQRAVTVGPPYELGGGGARLLLEVNVPPEIELLPEGARLPIENPETTLPEGLPPTKVEPPRQIPGEHNPDMPGPEGYPPPLPGVESPEASAPGGPEGLPPPATEQSSRGGKSLEDIKEMWFKENKEGRAAIWEKSRA
ncbi:hypothetical protein J3458_013173 [Metarhizium acridum]|uniref:Uncharacterized protein n=1 Tax=Metarhizium acridum (strain CQMa 102) TaxID=655827 RepID=E9E5R0_METAQ|nr:uncharacterized protein MAC_05208 [Metarhizium acridum CQMa 102]EFY88773.1 hypothetical protein MAC_05208 [Metarhizium acridum CQMa 102]KAG8412732.1 hypothetical protein J3458_013173 [Metarhizium acridum]